jgi:hypothetical protein
MRKLLFAAAAAGAVLAIIPASIPAYAGGAGVRVGPFSAGVGPAYDEDWRWRHREGRYYGSDREGRYYGSTCRTVRERIETPSGRVIFRTHRTCE